MERRRGIARRGTTALAVLAAVVAGCAPGIRRVSTPDAAFIYGFFDVPEKVGSANCVGIIQAEKVGIAGRAGCMMTSPEGLFYIEDVPPIRHNVHAFYVDNTHNSLGSMAKPFAVKPGELRLWGIYKYEVVSKPFLVGQGT